MTISKGNLSEAAKAIIERIMELYHDAYVQELNDLNIPASGALSDFEVDYTIDDEHFVVTFDLEHYWKYIENGTGKKAGHNDWKGISKEMVNNIAEWITVKNVPIPASIKGKDPRKSFAYAISHKLAFGVPSKGILSGTYPKKPLLKAQNKVAKEKDRLMAALIDEIAYSEMAKNLEEMGL